MILKLHFDSEVTFSVFVCVCVCMCVCVCVWCVRVCVCVCVVCVCACVCVVCVCVCVCVYSDWGLCPPTRILEVTQQSGPGDYIHVSHSMSGMWLSVGGCVCVCERESESERESLYVCL